VYLIIVLESVPQKIVFSIDDPCRIEGKASYLGAHKLNDSGERRVMM
jgi:hypothetical protein